MLNFLYKSFFIFWMIQSPIASAMENAFPDYNEIVGLRVPFSKLTIKGKKIEEIEKVEKWHRDYSDKVQRFSDNTQGKFKGCNWAFASIAPIYHDLENDTFSVGNIETLPHFFGSGNTKKPPDIKNQEIQKTIDEAREGLDYFFADMVFKGEDPKKGFILDVINFISPDIDLFVALPHRPKEKMEQAFAPYFGGDGDLNQCWNWFSDSEQTILSVVRNNITPYYKKLIEKNPNKKTNPCFFVINIVTLQDMCGMCSRSSFIQSKNGIKDLDIPLLIFITGTREYKGTRSDIKTGETADIKKGRGALVITDIGYK